MKVTMIRSVRIELDPDEAKLVLASLELFGNTGSDEHARKARAMRDAMDYEMGENR